MIKIIVSVCLLILYVFVQLDSNEIEVNLVSCVDGDTAIFEIDGKKEKVRFLAIDTYEVDTEMGKKASSYVCNTLKKATTITLEFDENAYKDKYDRVLAWVFVDDTLLQEELVSIGYAQVKYLYDDYKYADRLIELEKEAQNNKVGIWSDNHE